jgi:hypothetical protein
VGAGSCSWSRRTGDFDVGGHVSPLIAIVDSAFLSESELNLTLFAESIRMARRQRGSIGRARSNLEIEEDRMVFSSLAKIANMNKYNVFDAILKALLRRTLVS